MKTLRLIGMTLLAVVMCMNFVSCGDDDDDDKNDNAVSLVGKWKVEKSNYEGETEPWDGLPYFVVTESHLYFTDDAGKDKSDYCTYTYDADKKVINAKYVEREYSYIIKVIKLTDTEFQWQWDEDGKDKWTTLYCKKVS